MASERRAEFDALYERHRREVWAALFARLLDSHAALDLAQEAFLRLWRAWQQGEAIQNPRAWLLRVARNQAEDLAKSAFRRNGTHPPEFLDRVLSREPSALSRLAAAERAEQVRNLLRELPEVDREVLTYRYGLEYDTERIAELLGTSLSAVHMRLSRARQRLAERLAAQGVTSHDQSS